MKPGTSLGLITILFLFFPALMVLTLVCVLSQLHFFFQLKGRSRKVNLSNNAVSVAVLIF